jgi:lysophospholipase L1-like esterase
MIKPLFTPICFLALILLFNSCAKQNINPINNNIKLMQPREVTYLALGDSYTIGESVPLAENFPNQLAKSLNSDSVLVTAPQIVAKTGWTTDELLDAISKTTFRNKYDMVTLLIGVNNQYRNYDIAVFRTEFKKLLNLAINFASADTKKVFVLSIPDWGLTPFAQKNGRNEAQIAQEINTYNAICKEEAEKLNVKFIDITPISRLAKTDLSLLANDGLHPSGKMYELWVKELIKTINLKL